jgi:two-component system, cell cycle response regulator
VTLDGETVISDLGSLAAKQGSERTAVLIVLKGEEVGRRYLLNETQLIVGRDPERANIVILDRAVSGAHSKITVDPFTGSFVITDLQSRNGMLVNASKTDRAVLKEGDCIFIGCTILKFAYHDALEEDFHKQLDSRMNFDELTGLPIKRVFDTDYRKEFELARRAGGKLAVLMMDMDGLKKVNDTHGHQAGSFCVSEVGGRIAATIHHRGVACRFGGDEFVAYLPGFDLERAAGVGEEIRSSVEARAFTTERFSVNPTISIGVAVRDDTTLTPEELVRRADDALYRAKRAGRNCVAR